MGIYPINPPCPICGGKVSRLLPAVIADEYVCDDCFSTLDMSRELQMNLTMNGFRTYLAYYNQQQPLRDSFKVDEAFDFGLTSGKIIIDHERKCFCMSHRPDKLIFEASQVKSFLIKEDNLTIIEGSLSGLTYNDSPVIDRAMAMRSRINCFNIHQQMAKNKLNQEGRDGGLDVVLACFNEAEPLDAFCVEIEVEHPYWKQLRFTINGPRLNPEKPDLNDYLCKYRQCVAELQRLAKALFRLTFSENGLQPVAIETMSGTAEMAHAGTC